MIIYGLVLAGGRSVRFGREKAAEPVRGRLLLERPLAVLNAACARVAVNAPEGSAAARFAEAEGLARIGDAPGDPLGPLAGVKAGLAWAQASGASALATAPCDTPFLPEDMVARLLAALDDSQVAVARTAQGLQSLCAVWRVEALPVVAEALAGGAHPPVRAVLDRLNAAEAPFADAEAFANINTQDDLSAADKRLER